MTAVTLANTFGALEIGSWFAVFLFGVVTLQAFIYFERYPDDRLVFKALIACIWCLELGHTTAIICEVYRTTIISWGRVEEVVRFPALGVAVLLGGFITTLVQLFFSYRLYIVLPKPYNYAGVGTAIAAFTRCVMSTYGGGVQQLITTTYIQYIHDFRYFMMGVLFLGAAIDATIAGALMFFLLYRRERAPLIRSKRLIDRLLGITIRTGLVTSMAAISVVIVYLAQPNNLIFFAVYMSLSKLYSNSLLSSLNNRKSLRDGLGNSFSVEVPRIGTNSRAAYTNPISIEMKTITQVQEDKF
ncbi:hypothetical protein BJ912DRAFT_1125776 [Pholiota molesta]|nr:hypothetical protein BJ912DRAFT_1125776 [Pholiota molesta]